MSTTYEFDLPVILTAAGAQPTPPATLQTQELAYVQSVDPDVTTNLPGLLIEDVLNTQVGALVVIDAARVEALNCISPNVANVSLLNDLGAVYGVTQGGPTNTSVGVVFSGSVGYVIPQGFLVGDGTYVYAVQYPGGVIGSSGFSQTLTAIAVQTGSWSVAANSVTQLQTSVPVRISLAVTNPNPGIPGDPDGESYSSYRTRVCQAGLAACVGTPRFIKTLVCQLAGLSANQVSVQQASPGIRAIVVGADAYEVGFALFMAVADVSQLVGSEVSSGRNVTVGINDYPNTYDVEFVASPAQTVTIAATWNTEVAGFTGGGAFPSLVQQPLADYINSLAPGQPINVLEMNTLFQAAIAGVLDPTLLTRLVFVVSINSTVTPPATGTYAVSGDPESYFTCTASSITVNQG